MSVTQRESSGDTRTESASFVGVTLVLSLIAACGFCVFVCAYARTGERLLEQSMRKQGMIYLEQAERLETAGEYENAAQHYRLALEAEFDAHKYRTYTLKRLGALLWWREGPQAALPYLQEAFQQPDAPITLYEPLCDSLIQLGRRDEVYDVLARWREEAHAGKDREQEALSYYYEGKAFQESGDEAKAREAFMAGTQVLPGGRSAYELGVAFHREGDDDGALLHLEQFLVTASGDRARYARTLMDEILQRRVKKDGSPSSRE
ncbi:MAG: hypothetical protein IT365_15120 [Candidatus Hydrogenedentes bacterium]|nr:hypothetical protein [Candidatus Hydrogenedentota bacterium]